MKKNKTAGASGKKQKIAVPGPEPTENAAAPPAGVFPVVGIGASAGGLAAFEAFFSGLPADTDPGMAFVLVQHLDPNHKSLLTDLIKRCTRMEVFEVEDGMRVRPNCVYIIPPGRDMAFLGGSLHLLEPSAPRGRRLPIDFFFRSLAQDQRERAICVVLTGTGTDGTLGVRAVKGEGGMVMVQSPASAEYDGMPRAAIATGMVDYELPPPEMPAQIIAYASHAYSKPPLSEDALPESGSENAVKKIFILLRLQTGHDFSQYKPSTIYRRIERRMAVQQIDTMDGYVKYLQQTKTEAEALFRDLLIGVTKFFRDTEAFKALEDRVVPQLFAGKTGENSVRIWVPGCSTGEEAYSLAIILTEHQEKIKQTFKVQIFATDIDGRAITAARAGFFPASISADVSPERLSRFFTPEANSSGDGPIAYRINKNIRDMLVFSEQDLIKDPPFSRLDLIGCRNLLIYMGADLQKRIIPLFHYALKPEGFLFLGTSETVGTFPDLFTAVDRKYKLYQRKENIRTTHSPSPSLLLPPRRETLLPPKKEKPPAAVKPPLCELMEQEILQHVALTAILVKGQGDILFIHGRAGLYLEPAPGEAGVNNILKMAREGLRPVLTSALHKAAETKEPVKQTNLRVKTNGSFTMVNLSIRPVNENVPSTTPSGPLYLVVLEEVSAVVEDLPAGSELKGRKSKKKGPDAETGIAELRQELRDQEEYLEAAREELETSNEELKSSNEEMQSVNEELQSTNEELETSKEELQSINEELSTVNSELQTKVADLSQANNDMNNLLAGTGIATVFVDHGLQILRFTPTATKIINLIQSDMGRPVGHIVSNLKNYSNLVEDTKGVLNTLIPKEVEVETLEGLWYVMRIQPYRTLDNVIEGAVLTFVDITESKRMKEALRESEARLRALMEKRT
jgi:two-component system CheB/CheR fusion protein